MSTPNILFALKTHFSFIFRLIESFFRKSIYTGSSGATEIAVPATQRAEKEISQEILDDKSEKPKAALSCTPRITSNYGWRVIFGKDNFHSGIDFYCKAQFGYPVVAPEDGVVTLIGVGSGGINYVAIKGDLSNGYHYLCHVGNKNNTPSTVVTKGQRVKAGDLVGYTNNTGRLTGPHLHHAWYDAKWINKDVVKNFYKLHAPELVATLDGYKDRGHKHPKDKS